MSVGVLIIAQNEIGRQLAATTVEGAITGIIRGQ